MRTYSKLFLASAAGAALTVQLIAPAGAIGVEVGPITGTPLKLDPSALVACLAAAPAHLQGQLATANIVVGTKGNDDLSPYLTAGPDLVCGGNGNDTIAVLGVGDVFLGQTGADHVTTNHGLFEGGDGNDTVGNLDDLASSAMPTHLDQGNFAEFNGGAGADLVSVNGVGSVAGEYDRSFANLGNGLDRVLLNFGYVYGQANADEVSWNHGYFNGGGDNDVVTENGKSSIFDAGAGDDYVGFNRESAGFYGGAGDDEVHLNYGLFYGGAGADHTDGNPPSGTVYGEEDDDTVDGNSGLFLGGDGDDRVWGQTQEGSFYGEAGDDGIDSWNEGFFDGGEGFDYVVYNLFTGVLVNVEHEGAI